jgi:peptidoglycan/LPS O-acetylase OafA/YrhL
VPAALALAGALTVVVGAAWLVHRFVEVPAGPRVRAAVERGLVRARAVVLDPVTVGPRLLGLHG